MGTSLRMVNGIGANTERQLQEFNINTAEDLAAADIASIASIKNFGEIRAYQIQKAAIDLLARINAKAKTPPDVDTNTVGAITPPVVEVASVPAASPVKEAPNSNVVATTSSNQSPVPQAEAATIITQTQPPASTTVAAPKVAASRDRDRYARRSRATNSENKTAAIKDNKQPQREQPDNRQQRTFPQLVNEREPQAKPDAPAARERETVLPPVATPVAQTQISTSTMALFCDFENIALGVRDARYSAFDIQKVLERLLLKGNIVVRKAYCDWERYKDFKAPMHEAAFELIEIPHIRQSGKNSADIRMVVDALDLCYTKQHLDTFVIISGDSDFTSLVTKLRENNKTVIGVGVKKSTSDLFTSNCDEFIFYDDLLRESTKEQQRKQREDVASTKAAPKVGQSKEDEKMQEALDLVLETVEDLFEERGEEEKVWGSMVKQAVKRRKPGFNERYHGFHTFSKLLEEAAARRMLDIQRDEKSGGYIIIGFSRDD